MASTRPSWARRPRAGTASRPASRASGLHVRGPDAPGLDALARIIGWKLTVHAVPTQGVVTVTSAGGETNRYPAGTPVTFPRIPGHRDGNNTSCPGDALYAQLEQLRRRRAVRRADRRAEHLRRARGARAQAARCRRVAALRRRVAGRRRGGHARVPQRGRRLEADGHGDLRGGRQLEDHRDVPEAGIRAPFAGDSVRPALVSPPRRITVLASLRLSLTRKRLRYGNTFTARGTATRRRPSSSRCSRRRRWVPERTRLLRVRNGSYKAGCGRARAASTAWSCRSAA